MIKHQFYVLCSEISLNFLFSSLFAQFVSKDMFKVPGPGFWVRVLSKRGHTEAHINQLINLASLMPCSIPIASKMWIIGRVHRHITMGL